MTDLSTTLNDVLDRTSVGGRCVLYIDQRCQANNKPCVYNGVVGNMGCGILDGANATVRLGDMIANHSKYNHKI